MNTDKLVRYNNLIGKVKEDYKANPPKDLSWCNECQNEINLWSYWHGFNSNDTKILLVGQDWGCPFSKENEIVLNNIKRSNIHIKTPYMIGNSSLTDANLIKLFKAIGYDIAYDEEKNNELFFTNFILGYRNKGNSGNLDSSWFEHDKSYFKELTEILSPKYILCLGRKTFESVLKALEIEIPLIKSYNDFLNSGKNYIDINNGDLKIRIAALAHCGVLGTHNRNRANADIKDHNSLELQIKDWKNIFKY